MGMTKRYWYLLWKSAVKHDRATERLAEMNGQRRRKTEMAYNVGDILAGKAIMGGTTEYVVTKVNRVTVQFMAGGNVYRSRPDEEGNLWITRGKHRVVRVTKAVAPVTEMIR
jgi:hypothetical protein